MKVTTLESTMGEWREIRLWYTEKATWATLYDYKRDVMLPALEQFNISSFLCLDAPGFVKLRTLATEQAFHDLYSHLETDLPDIFSLLTTESWSPEEDARERILSAKRTISADDYILSEGGWKIMGMSEEGEWLIDEEDIDRQTEAFSTFMTEILGPFTKLYLEKMPYRVEDRWMNSVFVHLLLNSLSVWQDVEGEIRRFPYV